jgi:3-isopropylmalate/(R)-2-methylmalate dehydratase large subunit
MKKTMYEKIWDAHLVHEEPGQAPILYIDRHLVHEVTSPQAFEGLQIAKRPVRQPHAIMATLDHCVPTKDRDLPIKDPIARKQVEVMI